MVARYSKLVLWLRRTENQMIQPPATLGPPPGGTPHMVWAGAEVLFLHCLHPQHSADSVPDRRSPRAHQNVPSGSCPTLREVRKSSAKGRHLT